MAFVLLPYTSIFIFNRKYTKLFWYIFENVQLVFAIIKVKIKPRLSQARDIFITVL